ncbi:MAG: 2-C-methyl-D-erythritol 2,4-cyclodiphosphate synthase, partial [Xanthomonadales bacterium]|nr:2-C-methyl-D-erythritol 2,4-cyclodiphosphate synthase [Xanthomonadales bacterium]
DAAWRGVDSRILLAAVRDLLRSQGWKLVNADLTIACERPRIGPQVSNMRAAIAAVLDTDVDAISVKATTTEKLGFCGRGEGIAALAVVLIESV